MREEHLYKQIAESIRKEILHGDLKAGERKWQVVIFGIPNLKNLISPLSVPFNAVRPLVW